MIVTVRKISGRISSAQELPARRHRAPDHRHRPVTERVDKPNRIAHHVEMRRDRGRRLASSPRGAAIAAFDPGRSHDTRLGQGQHHLAPAIGKLRKAMQKHTAGRFAVSNPPPICGHVRPLTFGMKARGDAGAGWCHCRMGEATKNRCARSRHARVRCAQAQSLPPQSPPFPQICAATERPLGPSRSQPWWSPCPSPLNLGHATISLLCR